MKEKKDQEDQSHNTHLRGVETEEGPGKTQNEGLSAVDIFYFFPYYLPNSLCGQQQQHSVSHGYYAKTLLG